MLSRRVVWRKDGGAHKCSPKDSAHDAGCRSLRDHHHEDSFKNDLLAETLLQTGIELIAPARLQRLTDRTAEHAIGETARARRARQDQVLVVRRLEIVRV